MTIQEKISLASESGKVYFFKEGIFYKMYNKNAMWFVQKIKAYKIHVKYVKTISQNVYSIGFPIAIFDQFGSRLKEINTVLQDTAENYMLYSVDTKIEDGQYKTWCEQYIDNKKETNSHSLKDEIKNFDLANKTPMEALEFISKLQKEL